RNVLFPEPDGPMIAVNDPRSRARSMPRSATTADGPEPYCLTTDSRRIAEPGPGDATSGVLDLDLMVMPLMLCLPVWIRPGMTGADTVADGRCFRFPRENRRGASGIPSPRAEAAAGPA